MASRVPVLVAQFLMKTMETKPSPHDPTLRERFNLKEFLEASPSVRRAFMLEIARERYDSECEMHIHHFFGVSLEQMRALLQGRIIMELGCFVGGSAVAHAEAYGVTRMLGVDIEDVFLEAARLFTANREGQFEFVKGRGESLPLPSESCDAILTQDTLEHVNDVDATLRESFRVLRPGGLMFCVFPGFFHPWGNHLGMVTRFPWLHLAFSDAVLETAYHAIIARRGESAYWYTRDNAMAMHRGRFHGVNGITAWRFRKLTRAVGFAIVRANVTPIFSVGRRIQRWPWLRIFALPLWPLARLPVLEEVLLHRMCYILQKPPVTGLAAA